MHRRFASLEKCRSFVVRMMKSILKIKCSLKCCCRVFMPARLSPNQVTGVLKKNSKLYSDLSLHLNQKKTEKMGSFTKKVTLNDKPKRKRSVRLYYSVTRLFVLQQISRLLDPKKTGHGPGPRTASYFVAKQCVNEWIPCFLAQAL